jgi:hypothetical protein
MDFIPARNAQYVPFVVNAAAVIAADYADYGIPLPVATDLTTKANAVESTFTLAQDPLTRTPVAIDNFNTARAACTAALRTINATAQAFGTYSEQLIAAGLPVRDTVRSPQTPITSTVDLAIVSQIPELLRVVARNPETPTSKRKPSNTRAVQFAMAVGTVAAVDPSAATEYRFGTRVPYDIQTTTAQRGKTLTLWARYQSRGSIGGQLVYGPWSLPLVVHLM